MHQRSTYIAKPSMAHLYSGFGETAPHGQLLSGVDVRVVRALEDLLHLFQLIAGECRPIASLLTLRVIAIVTGDVVVNIGDFRRGGSVAVTRSVHVTQ